MFSLIIYILNYVFILFIVIKSELSTLGATQLIGCVSAELFPFLMFYVR